MGMSNRPIHRIVDEQVRRWEMLCETQPDKCLASPVISISRLPGCSGSAIAKEVAREMGFEFFDKEILDKISTFSNMSAEMIESVDDKVLSRLDEWVESLIWQRYPSQDYCRCLKQALLAIAKRGRAVILGRGANFFLPVEACLRVLLVAPLETRASCMARRLNLSHAQALARIAKVEAERRGFIRGHFHREMTDPAYYDICLNIENLSFENIVDAIRLAWQMKSKACALMAKPKEENEALSTCFSCD